jgi:response regulator RpfG family c-di-GMP phosphodiesterase
MKPTLGRLLLVEDRLGDERLFREMLRDLGYPRDAVTTAGSVAAALEALRRDDFEVVFLDLTLPDSRGVETLERVLAGGHDVPVIVFTGLDDQAVGERAVEIGAHDYLVKGEVHADVLARVIRYAVSRHRAIAAAKHESARAAAALARLEATQESRAALEHEVAERRVAQVGLERSLARLQAMRSIDRAIIANRTVTPMLQVVLHEGVKLLGADAAIIMLVDEEAGTLVPTASYGVPMLAHADDPVPLSDPTIAESRRNGWFATRIDEGPSRSPRSDRLRAAGFTAYHAIALHDRERLLGILEVLGRGALPSDRGWRDFLETLADQAAVAIGSAGLQQRLVRANIDLVAAYDATLDGWSRALDLRDHETEGHSRRVTHSTVVLARMVGVAGDELSHLTRGALLHDIGKMGVPDAILQKPGPLDAQEWLVMRQHPALARDLLEPIAFLRPAVEIPYAHHERWDGGGYPEGLVGTQIPLGARIFAVADVFDALTSDRSYRPAWTRERALAYVQAQAGRHFDPDMVQLFVRMEEMAQAS